MMAPKSLLSSPFFSFLLFMILTLNSGGRLKMARANDEGEWCVAKPSSQDVELMNNINYVCNEQGLDCGDIAENGPCFNPNTALNHASVAMNIYYQQFGRNYWNCNFTCSALITVTDPSFIGCHYKYNETVY